LTDEGPETKIRQQIRILLTLQLCPGCLISGPKLSSIPALTVFLYTAAKNIIGLTRLVQGTNEIIGKDTLIKNLINILTDLTYV
jgi:hypothetical protein